MFSCRQILPERHYKSLDEATGGFNEFYLELNSNQELILQIESSKTVSITDTGNIIESRAKTVTGKWTMSNSHINCTFNESKFAIDSFFIDTDFNDTFVKKQLIKFSPKLDTAYIYGIPCKLIVNK